jgi:hypothetical protein
MTEPALIGITEAAAKSGINKYTLGEGVRKKQWPHHRVGTRVMFTQTDIDAIVAMTAVKPRPTESMRRPAS